MKKLYLTVLVVICSVSCVYAANMQVNPQAKSFKYSTTIEKLRSLGVLNGMSETNQLSLF